MLKPLFVFDIVLEHLPTQCFPILVFYNCHQEYQQNGTAKMWDANSECQVRKENPILYSHKTQLNIKLSLLQHYNNFFRPKLSAIFRLYMKPI